MGSMNVYDDGSQSWGSIGSGFASAIMNAPAKAAAQQHTIETIKDQRIKREREQIQWDAALAAANAVPAATPAAVAPPSTMTVPGPYVGDPASDPGVTRDLPTADVTYIDPRAQTLAEAQRKLAISGQQATVITDPKQWAPQMAYGTVAAAGVPDSAKERARLDFLAGKGMPTHLGVDESKSPLKNFNELDPTTNQPTGRQVSANKAPGPNWVLGSARSLTPDNPIESVPIAQNNFHQLADKIQAQIAAGQPVSDVDLNAARIRRDAGWQKEIKIEKNAETGQLMPIVTYKIPPPTSGPAAGLMQLLDSIDGRPAAAAPPPPPPPPPDAAGGAAAAVPPAPAAVPPAPAAPAGSPLIQVQPSVGPGDVPAVVKRYTDIRQVDNLAQAASGYNSMVANMPFDNAASDLAIIIGAAKTLDPPSVVRNEEGKNVSKTVSVLDQFEGMLNRATGGAGLNKQARAQIWNMVQSKLQRDRDEVASIREQHAVQIKQRNADPEAYLPKIPELVPVDNAIINSKAIDASQAGTGVRPAGTVTPPPSVTPPPPRPRF